jgi:hypothetical protein
MHQLSKEMVWCMRREVARADIIRIPIKIVNRSRSIPSQWRSNYFNFINLLILSVMERFGNQHVNHKVHLSAAFSEHPERHL